MFSQQRVLIAARTETLRRRLAAKLLEREIFSDVAIDGSGAIEKLASTDYAVLLLDLTLDGADAVHRLLSATSSDATRPIVIALAADHTTIAENDFVQIVLRRPFDALQIADIVKSCLEALSDGTRKPDAIPSPSEPPPPKRLDL